MDSFSLSQVLNNFQNFERKLDKLQDDISNHGYTLCELRCLMADLTSGKTTHSAEKKCQWPKKTIAVQYETGVIDGPFKQKKTVMKPIVKMGGKSRVVKPIVRYPLENDASPNEKEGANMKGAIGAKIQPGPVKTRKAEVPKKPTNLRDHRFEKKQKKRDLSL